MLSGTSKHSFPNTANFVVCLEKLVLQRGRTAGTEAALCCHVRETAVGRRHVVPRDSCIQNGAKHDNRETVRDKNNGAMPADKTVVRVTHPRHDTLTPRVESHDVLDPPWHCALDRRRHVAKRVRLQEGEFWVIFQDLVVRRERPRGQCPVCAWVAPLGQ